MTAPGAALTMPAPQAGAAPAADKPIFPPYLSATHVVWQEQHTHWEREERRLYGGDLVLDELIRFDWEQMPGAHYASRKTVAHYVNLPRMHASLITQHVSKKRPKPGAGLSFGTLGQVREREEQTGRQTRAEMLYYNADGIGQDGKEWASYWDGVCTRAEATGHRFMMVETPRVDPTLQQVLTLKDELAGVRPYLVEYSPVVVPNWWYHNGELQFAVLRPVVDEPYLTQGTLWMPQLGQRGWYLLVREGCTILGDEYAKGGWWIWDSQLRFIDAGDWGLTRGRIPLFPVFSEHDPGTDKHPSISRSQTMELGQCAVGIMNLISARDYDAFNAAMSKTFLLGVDPEAAKIVVDSVTNSQIVSVPAVEKEDGSVLVPQVYDGSAGAVAAEVFKTLLESKLAEAHQTMMEQASASQTSSGAKQVASFAEASSPLLVARARNRQNAECTALYFAELRWGTVRDGAEPESYSVYPDDYELAPLIDDIDAQLDTLRRASAIVPAKSAGLIVDLIIQSLAERGLMPKDMTEDELRSELLQSVADAQAQAAAQSAARAAALSGLNSLTNDKPGTTPVQNTLPVIQPPANSAPAGAPTPAAAKAA